MAIVKDVFIIVVLFLIPALAKADSVWTYQGNAVSAGCPAELVHTCSGDGPMTGTVLLNDQDQVEAWSFIATAGTAHPLVLTNLNTTDVSFNIFNCASC